MGRKGGFEDEALGGAEETRLTEGQGARSQGDSTGDAASPPEQPTAFPADGNWQVTERLLQTLNQELGGLKEYVLTELRGEIAALRSEKVQLQSQVQELRHQQEVLVSDRQQAQQQQWAQQFAQVMTQNLRQQLQSEVFGLSEAGGTLRPEQRLLVLHQQMVSLEEGLGAAIQVLNQELGQHQSELSQQLLRMEDLEQQGEALLAALVQKMQAQLQAAPGTTPSGYSPQLVEGELSSIELPNSQGSGELELGSSPPGMQGLVWAEPGLSQDNGEALSDGGAASSAARLPGHPTDVASVMAAMSGLKPPAADATMPVTAESLAEAFTDEPAPSNPSGEEAPHWSEELGGEPALGDVLSSDQSRAAEAPAASTRAAAMPSPPRLTTPVPANPMPADISDPGPDESFIADFPIDAVRPDVSGFPAAGTEGMGQAPMQEGSGDALQEGAVSFDVTSPGPTNGLSLDELYGAVGRPSAAASSEGRVLESAPLDGSPLDGLGGGIAMPPGMVDRVQGEVEPPQPPVEPVAPWEGEPPTTISSLLELTDGTVSTSSQASDVGAMNLSVAEMEGAAIAAPSATQAVLGSPGDDEAQPQRSIANPLRRSGAVIAVVALLLWAVQYATVQVLFHGAPWIAGGQGFIAATWSNALVTFWIRMLMVLPFMIVIGQGLYPPLLPEMQAVFRDRDRIPLYSIAASGLFFFLAHFLLYGSIASSSATPAVALFFLYPALGQLLGWSLFNQRLSSVRLLTMVPLVLGALWLLVLWSSPGGRVAGLASGLCYALFLMLTAVNGRRMNAMTLTVLQFGLAWLWAVPAVFFLPRAVPMNDVGYVMACAILSATVGLSQLVGLASRRRLGAGLSALVQGTLPLVVGLVCLFVTDEVLPLAQVFGVLLVSGGAVALGWQRASRETMGR